MRAVGSVGPKGQVTIPLEMRQRLGIKPKDKVEFALDDGQIKVSPARSRLSEIYRSVPPLDRPLTDQQMSDVAWDEHAQHVAREDG